MVYTTGKPIVFVGVGQKYPHLKKLNVQTVISALMSWVKPVINFKDLMPHRLNIILTLINKKAKWSQRVRVRLLLPVIWFLTNQLLLKNTSQKSSPFLFSILEYRMDSQMLYASLKMMTTVSDKLFLNLYLETNWIKM